MPSTSSTAAIALSALVATLAACGGKTTTTLVDDGAVPQDGSAEDADAVTDDGIATGDATNDAQVPGDAVPPPPPAGDAGVTNGTTKWFVVNALKLGLTPRDSNATSLSAWKDYGYDLDGRVTTKDDSINGIDTCTRVPGSPSSMLIDGNGGRDNNFGGRVMQVISQLQDGVEAQINAGIAAGGGTMLLRLANVGAADNASVPGALYLASPLPAGATPKFDGTDAFGVYTTSLTDGATIANAKVTFPHGYMTGGVWVSGVPSYTESAAIPLPIFDWMELPVVSPIVSVTVSDGTYGTIAGALGVQDVQNGLGPWAAKFGICPSSSTYQQILNTLSQSADLSLGHPQLQNVGATCNAISLGLGFTMKPIPAPTIALAPPPAAPNPCGP